jgi:hypothetical protein
MTTPTNLKVDDLNFSAIKENLKAFIQSQDQFTDVNFDASGISILIDLLAYNTYYNSSYLNFASLESYLSTAQNRNSVVNIVRSLNYTPKSTISARITGTIVLNVNGDPATVTIPKYTKFITNVDGTEYTFLTTEPHTIFRSSSGIYSIDDITLTEGKFASERYVVNAFDSDQRYLINNPLVDTTTLSVNVVNSISDSTTRNFTRAPNSVIVDQNSEVFFIEEVEDGKFQLFFGDGTIGVSLNNGNIINIDYLVSSGILGNNIKDFSSVSSIPGVISIQFESYKPSSGGNDRESIASIKFNAPRFYAAQNRIVTSEDYAALLSNEPNIGSVAVWGGEDNDPPTYGKVFVAIKPTIGDALSATEKRNIIESIINPKKVLTVNTVIVDPEYINLILNVNVKYDPTKTVLGLESLKSLIFNTVKKYNQEDISQFTKYFRYSKLTRLIDSTERSILNNFIDVTLRKETNVQLNQRARYIFDFSNYISPITAGRSSNHPYGVGNQVTSNAFTYLGFNNCFLEDNNGIMRIYRKVGIENIGVNSNVGTINYETGKIILNDFNPSAFADGGVTLKITAKPRNLDVLPLRGQIITILDEDININIEDDTKISLVKR